MCNIFSVVTILLHSLLAVQSETYDVIVIPIQNISIKTKNVIYGSKNVKKRQFLRLDIEENENPTELPDVDNVDYGNDRKNDKEDKDNLYVDYGVNKIVGGTEVDINLYPYHVAYGTNCGGAIIDKEWVITAGHCGKKPYIRVGSKYLNQGKKVLVKHSHIHPMWGAKKKDHPFDYDFQLLELDEHLKYDENIQQIKIAHIEDMVIGKVITVTGWGNTEENVQARVYPADLVPGRLHTPFWTCRLPQDVFFHRTT